MSTNRSPWLALACDCFDDPMFDGAVQGVRLSWVCLLMHVKAHGRAGSARFNPVSFARRHDVDPSAVNEMIERASSHGAIVLKGEDLQLVNWDKWQAHGAAPRHKRGKREKPPDSPPPRTERPRTEIPGPETEHPYPATALPDARVVDEILSAFPSEGIPGDARHAVHRRSIAEGVRMLADSPPSDFRGHPPFAAGDSSGAAAWALARTREYAGSAAAASHCMNLRTFFVGTAERPAGVMDDSRRWRDRDAKPKAPPSTADVVAAAVRDGSYRQWPTDRLERCLHALLEVKDERALRAEYERRTP